MSKELTDLLAGDKVIMRSGYGRTSCVVEIERITDTQIVIAKLGRFRRQDGRAVGRKDPYNAPRIVVASPELIESLKLQRRIDAAGSALSKVTVTTDNLERVEAFLASLNA